VQPPIIALVTDLIFTTKIRSTAAAVGAPIRLIRSTSDLPVAAAGNPVGLVILDLNAAGLDVASAVAAARALPGSPRVVAYLSHVQTDLAVAARAAGADEILARSTFTARLPALLAEYSGE
jgi:DNA-binding NarL/FixJ family response regulator